MATLNAVENVEAVVEVLGFEALAEIIGVVAVVFPYPWKMSTQNASKIVKPL